MLYKLLPYCNSNLKQLTRRSTSVLKIGEVDVDVCISSHLKEELAWAADK